MRVALDATLWDEPTTGIGLYTRKLAAALQSQGVNVELWGARHSHRSRSHPSRTRFLFDELPRWLEAERPDVFHAVSNFNLPLLKPKGTRFVLTVHDLIPLLLPETVSLAFRWQFRLMLGRALKLADAVVCVSETTRNSLESHFGPHPALTVAPNGVDHVLEVPQADRITEQWLDAMGLDAPFVLYVGALDARKNVELVLEACARLSNVRLVIAGQKWFGAGAIEEKIKRTIARGVRIENLGYLEAPVLYALMRRAAAFAFPSRYEGFGLPPLEAMRLGVPTVVSTAGALPEVVGDGAMKVSPDDPDALAHALRTLLDSPEQRTAFSKRGLARAKEFTWDRTATLVRAAFGAP